MVSRYVVLAAILGSLLAGACTAAAASPSATVAESAASSTAPDPATMSPATIEPVQSPTPAPTTSPTEQPAAVPVPPKPSGVTFETTAEGGADGPPTKVTQTVTWRSPRSEGIEIRVYVTSCIARPTDPPPGSSGPCLVVHTPLPASSRTLLATAPASAGFASWTWMEESDCTSGPADAVVLAAYGASDHSIFVIADPGNWWIPDENDIVC